jgi:hypothetical protein
MVKTAMKEAFLTKNQAFFLRQRLTSLKMKDGHLLQSYLLEFNKLVEMLELSEIAGQKATLSEFEKMAAFLNGLPTKLQERVLFKQPRSCKELLEVVTAQTQTKELFKHFSTTSTTSTPMDVDALRASEEEQQEEDEEHSSGGETEAELAAFFRWRKSQHAQKARRPSRKTENFRASPSEKPPCWSCGRKGHFARDCQAKDGLKALQKHRGTTSDSRHALRDSQKRPKEKGKGKASKLNELNDASSCSGEEL